MRARRMFSALMRALERRQFLAILSAAGAGALLGCAPRPRRLTHIGVQLYTVRAELERDFDGTLGRLAEIGYREVEFAGYFGRTPAQVRSALARAGLTAPGSHIAFEATQDGWSRTLDDAAAAGHHWVVVPWIPEPARRTGDDWQRVAEQLGSAAEAARAAALRLAYHNQEYDFHAVDAVMPFHAVAAASDSGVLDFELDVYWAVKGGADPLALIARYPARFPLMHVKDSAGPPQHEMRDVGSGTLNWKAILDAGHQAGLHHVFVEHDTPADPFASVRAGFDYLQGVEF